MAQHDYDLINQNGSSFRADLNNALDAIVSNNSGSNEPSTKFAYEWWVDTTNDLLKIRNSANNAWITLPLSITADNSTSGALTVNGNLSTTGTLDVNGGEVILDADADTSITADTDDQIDFKTAGTDRVVITSTGRFGIGNTTPSQILNVQSATFPVAEISCFSDANPTDGSALDLVEKQPSFASASNTFGQTGVYGYRIKLNGSDNTLRIKSGAQTTVTDRIVLQRDSGAVGIGTVNGDVTSDGVSSRTYVAIVGSGNRGVLNLGTTASAGADGGKLSFVNGANVTGEISCDPDSGSATNGNLAFNTTNVQRMKITSSGRILINITTNPAVGGVSTGHFTEALSSTNWIQAFRNSQSTPFGISIKYTATPNDSGKAFIYCEDGAPASRFEVRSDGGIKNYSANNVNLSDEREKKNIVSADNQLENIKNLVIKSFHYNEDDDSADKRLGVIAQEVETNLPHLVEQYSNIGGEERKGVKEQQLMWMAIKAIQELEARVKTLEE